MRWVREDWPGCAVWCCREKVCLVLSSPYCFHHTPGNKWVKHMKIDAVRGWLRRMTPQAVDYEAYEDD